MDTPGGHEDTDSHVLVIGIASSMQDRLRLAERLDGFGPVVLASSLEEARALLNRGAPTNGSAPRPSNGDRPHHTSTHRNGTRLRQLDAIQVDSDVLLARFRERHVTLTPLEHDLLMCLGTEPRRTWTHAKLHEAVWNNRHGAGGRADIYSVVKRLRRKLTAIGAPTTIDAVRGVGFRLGETPGAGASAGLGAS